MSAAKNRLLTMLLLPLVCFGLWQVWNREQKDNWTRDGRIRADVVIPASEVNGRLNRLWVKDNQQVKRGDLLFEIDDGDYAIALEKSKAYKESARITMLKMSEISHRRESLTNNVVSKEEKENARLDYQQAIANYHVSEQQYRQALRNMHQTKVYSPVNGFVTNLLVQQGDYINVAQPVMTLVNAESFYAYAYFQEGQIAAIHPGQSVRITLLGSDITLHGTVENIARGIVDHSNQGSEGTLHNVNPTFDWVRLPMRIPVRIALDLRHLQGTTLVAGMTCTVAIQP
ncbi:HlyD family secretion protein [Erwinia sp. JUb26]|uniref:HlyD family secretion protein n=1 Tax=Erwinia sp. JUb26 TaxID=2485126 RepID=UPI000FA7952A|nr:HlyD family secretion protein [Erwinia sp. JUb26]ROR06795.1 RND family efflux transporter MFP subunit [Erwinia sp. JUb26]